MRIERDFLGAKKVPDKAYYGIFTTRAHENFKISGQRCHESFIRALAVIKKSAAQTNNGLGYLERKKSQAIIKACDEILKGKFHDQFILDIYQAGAGTPFNMNMNEVVANRAIEHLKGKKGDYKIIHPNDHVNMSQSSNDVIPTAIRLSCLFLLPETIKNIENLEKSFENKSKQFKDILKTGRTHLQDAVPITLGQEFKAYSEMIQRNIKQIKEAAGNLMEISIGGTAIGTGINTDIRYRKIMVKNLGRNTRLKLYETPDPIELTQSMDSFVQLSNSMKLLCTDLIKICNDLILLNSGPRTGIGEIRLPEVEPGSSIMPGKVNPSIPEAAIMSFIQILGNGNSIEIAAHHGQLELNTLTPLIAQNLINSILLLTNSTRMLDYRCIRGIKADKKRSKELLERSLSYATALNPYIGYEKVAELIMEAQKSGKSVKKLVIDQKLLTEKEYDKIISLEKLTRPNRRKK